MAKDSEPSFGAKAEPGKSAGSQGMMQVLSMLDAVDLPIVVINRDCKLIQINRAAAVLGLTAADIGHPLSKTFEGAENLGTLCAQVMTDGAPCRIDIRDGDRSFLLRMAPYTTAGHEILGAVLTFTNVTVFRASIDQAIYEREYTKAILNTISDPLVILDVNLCVKTANRAFYIAFGLSRDEAQGVPISKLGDHDWKTSEIWKSIEATLADDSDFKTVEVNRKFSTIGHRSFVLDARRLPRDVGALILLTFHDITDLKQAEKAVRESELSARLLQLQDEERRRLARELHDGIGQLLTAMSINVGRIVREKAHLSLEATRCLEENANLVRQISREIRTVSYLLHPPLLDVIGLDSALKWYVDGFAERSSLDAKVEVPSDWERLPKDDELCLFRIAQECLTNIHRHSGSSTARVKLMRRGEKIRMEVKDEGRGISQEAKATFFTDGRSGVGLRGMRERLKLLGGILEIHSDGNGTTVCATLPYKNDAVSGAGGNPLDNSEPS